MTETIRIPEDILAEHWFSLKQRVLDELQGAYRKVKDSVPQKTIAARLGKDPATISRCLRGDQNMTLRTMAALARGMGFRLDVSLTPLASLQTTNRPNVLEPLVVGTPMGNQLPRTDVGSNSAIQSYIYADASY
jgi:hypothetical protein